MKHREGSRSDPNRRSRGRRIAAVAAAAALIVLAAPGLAAAANAGAPSFDQAALHRSTEGLAPEEELSRQKMLHQWLMSEMPAGALDSPIAIQLTSEEWLDLENQDVRIGPLRVGMTKPVSKRIGFAAIDSRLMPTHPRPASHGVFKATPDGGFVWAASVHSEGAAALRVHITSLNLPADADLFIFNASGEAFGPYSRRGPNGTGDFWTNAVTGSTGVILLRHYGPGGAADLHRTSFSIDDIGHIGAKFPFYSNPALESFCTSGTTNAPCVENAMCHNGTPAESAKSAVALMQWISGAYIWTCSGGLVATNPPTQTPYFLTANHCISRDRDAKNLETYFQFQVSCGTTNCPSNPGGIRRLGATVKASNRLGDYTLLQLSQAPPSGSFYLGWNSQPIANTNGAKMYRISHPNWAPQAYSDHHVDTSAPTCSGWPRGERIYSRDDVGATEGGSSGSPVVNASGQIVGQLSGACGTNLGDVCDAVHNATVDGAFAYYYSSVAPYLNTGTSPEICNDLIDNDGDTFIDCADPDCTGSPACACKPAGATCTSNGECCSNSCKGAAGKKTCR